MIRDRGLIKWQPAHFMPEHWRLLNGVNCDDNKCKKPELDEQKLEEIGIPLKNYLDLFHHLEVLLFELQLSFWGCNLFNFGCILFCRIP